MLLNIKSKKIISYLHILLSDPNSNFSKNVISDNKFLSLDDISFFSTSFRQYFMESEYSISSLYQAISHWQY